MNFRRRLRLVSSRYLPWGLLAFCALNFLWSCSGGWELETGCIVTRHGAPGRGGYSTSQHRGVYSQGRTLVFAYALPGIHCMPGLRQYPPNVQVRVFESGLRLDADRPRAGEWWYDREYVRFPAWHPTWWSWQYFSAWGFGVSWDEDDHGVSIPWWFLCAVFAITPMQQCMKGRSLRRFRRRGLCPPCGYDLRATPERCPECGRKSSVRFAPAVAS